PAEPSCEFLLLGDTAGDRTPAVRQTRLLQRKTGMAEALEDAVEAKDKRVALIIAILALFLALAEAGGKNAQHRSTEQNIESSDLYNFYQAKKIRASFVEADIAQMEIARQSAADPKIQEAMDKQIATWKSMVSHYETDAKDGAEVLQERAKQASEGREL